MRKLIFITIILNSIFIFSQTKKDSILTELRTETINNAVKISKESDSTKITVYRLCDDFTDKIIYLKSNLTDLEIAELKTDKNASLKIIGLISDLAQNNTKENALGIMDNLIKSDRKIMSYGCHDAITTLSISQYFLNLITKDNLFFKPDFKLNKREVQQLENKIQIAENDYWRN